MNFFYVGKRLSENFVAVWICSLRCLTSRLKLTSAAAAAIAKMGFLVKFRFKIKKLFGNSCFKNL